MDKARAFTGFLSILTKGDAEMKTILSLGFVLLAGFLVGGPAHASFSDEHLDLLEQQVVVEDGDAVFTGLIENTHSSRSITLVSVYVVLKDAEGLIIDIVQGFPDDPLTDIAPGEQRPYAVETPYEESDFDTYTLRVEGVLSPISPHLKDSLVTGEVVILKEGLTFTTGRRDLVIIYGEIFNGTNAVITSISLTFTLYDSVGKVGTIVTDGIGNTLNLVELWPGQTRAFKAAGLLLVALDDVTEYRASLQYDPLRVVDDIATGVEETSWGQIKNHSRAESAR